MVPAVMGIPAVRAASPELFHKSIWRLPGSLHVNFVAGARGRSAAIIIISPSRSVSATGLTERNIISRGPLALQGRHVAQITNALIAGHKTVS
jgi:hypothetical protein